jgi:hypothetical protein
MFPGKLISCFVDITGPVCSPEFAVRDFFFGVVSKARHKKHILPILMA